MGAAETGGGGVDARIDFLAGWLAGVASLFVGHPLDTVKTRLQAVATSSHYGSETRTSAEEGRALLDEDRRSKGTREERGRRGPSAFKAVKVMMREEGVRGFYRGVTSPLLGVALMNACVFASYSSALAYLSSASPSSTAANATLVPPLASVFWAGAASGVATAFVTTPIDRIKILQQAHPGYTHGGGVSTVSVVRQVVKSQGVRGLWRGLGSTMARDTGYGPYFLTYDLVLRALSPVPDPTATTAEGEAPRWPLLLLAGGLAGVVGWTATFPLDVIKTRVMAADVEAMTRADLAAPSRPVTMWATARDAWREAGWRVFFRGLGPTVIRAVPVNAVTFFVYEAVVGAFR